MTEKNKLCNELKLIKKIQDTEDTVSLVFEIPPELRAKFRYRAGQFVTLFLDTSDFEVPAGGATTGSATAAATATATGTASGISTIHDSVTEIRRSYSLSSSPDYDSFFKISVKLVPGGRGSNYLVHKVKEGDRLWVTPPAGHFCLPSNLDPNVPVHFLFYAAGSGITPIISMIKTALKTMPKARCSLLYQSRHEHNIIFKAELDGLLAEFVPVLGSPEKRFQIEYAVTNVKPGWLGLRGRINLQVLREFLARQNITSNAFHFVCGPEGFMNEVLSGLADMGIDKNAVMKESFFIPTETKKFSPPEEVILIGDKLAAEAPEVIEAIIEGESHLVNYSEGKTVLDCLLDARLNPPYSCMDGACMACIAKVEKGLVYQNDMGILSDDNIAAGECLTCQARPASKVVKIQYEVF